MHVQSPLAKPAISSSEAKESKWIDGIALLVWLAAAVVAFLPFAFDTSPWDAVIFRVPDNQGNWWHFLAGAPFFLAFPMIWLRVRSLLSAGHARSGGLRVIGVLAALSMIGTTMVEVPFLLHLAGTKDWPSFSMLSLGFGTMAFGLAVLLLRRGRLSPIRQCIVGLNTAYLANAGLCLVVYSSATGTVSSRSGWFVSMLIVWPMAIELLGFEAFVPSAQRPDRVLRKRVWPMSARCLHPNG